MTQTNRLLHRLTLALMAAYLLALVLIVFWPSPVDRPASGQLHSILDRLHNHGLPNFINYGLVEFSANIAMFVPMGYIAATWFKKSWLGILTGFFASCFIELGQALFFTDRFATVMDILANTLGAAVGAGFYLLIRGRAARSTGNQVSRIRRH